MTPKSRRKTAPKAPGAALPKAIASVAPAVVVTPAVATEAPPTDTELAFLALYAEDAFCMAREADGDLKRVSPDPRLSPRWRAVGTLTADDAPLRVGKYKLGAREVFYGWQLIDEYGRRVLAIRGTEGFAEWIIDGIFSPRSVHPVAGKVESGFWDVFASMRVNGKPLSSIAQGAITVVGHSLGAALATYASLSLAKAGAKVRGVFVASPRPGNAQFCAAFGNAVPDHMLYANEADLVPKVPFGFGYSSVPNVTTLSAAKAGIRISGGLAGQHHVLTYAALMSRNAFASFKPLPCDQRCIDCIQL